MSDFYLLTERIIIIGARRKKYLDPLHVLDGVAEEREAQSTLGQCSVPPLDFPLRMVFRVQVGFRVGHHAENPPRRVAQSGDGVERAVGIVWKCLRCLIRVGIRVAAGYAAGRFQAIEQFPVQGEDLALPVAD
jgi:hypothetical protein